MLDFKFSCHRVQKSTTMKSILFLFSLLVVFDISWSQYVNTKTGPIQGTSVDFNGVNVHAFLGIPYAKPPVGELRFKRTEPVDTWYSPYYATTKPPACVQYVPFPYPGEDFEPGQSEDCLYLNIWAPSTGNQNSKKAVMFWIHGGGFSVGSGRKDLYNGEALAATGDVLVVTINYRLNALGFLTSFTEDAPGNVGLYDVLLSLKWVKDNIGAFGGDPNKITVFGQSAGGFIIGLLCISPSAQGLFNRAIMQSGSPLYLTDPFKRNWDLGERLAEKIGCTFPHSTLRNYPKRVVDCLRKIDAFVLVRTLNSLNATSLSTFHPIYGDKLLPEEPKVALKRGHFYNVDILAGNTKDENSYDITTTNYEVFGFFGEKNKLFDKSYGKYLLKKMLPDIPNKDDVINFYLGHLQENDYYPIRYQVYTALGDFIHICTTVYFVENYARSGNNVWYYFFVHRPSTSPWAPWMGVVHSDELSFVFGLPLRYPMQYTQDEKRLCYEMIDIWTTFAKTGRPNSNGKNLDWPLYSSCNPKYMVLNTTYDPWTKYGIGPHEGNCNFLRRYFDQEYGRCE